MEKSPADDAKMLEKLAFSKKNAAQHTKNIPIKISLLEAAATRYENAGRNWLKEAVQNMAYPRRVESAKLNAGYDYGLARKIRKMIRESNEGGNELERQLYAGVSIISLVSALFFTSFNLSGYAIGSLANDASLLGIVLFIVGLVFAFVFFRSKKKKF
jgi:hypothetical protein